MTVRLPDHLDLIAAAPAGIQKLRGLILELAVRGKLVAQDPNDEPASELLKRIAKERARLEAEGICKNSKASPLVGADEQPFALPTGWEWSRLAGISVINPRNAADDSIIASFVPMAMIGTRFEGTHSHEPRKWGEIKQGFTHFAEGDIGVAKITPCFENSKACVFAKLQNGLGAGTTELHIVRPIGSTLAPRYVLAYLKAPMFLLVGETRMTGTAGQKRLPKEFLETNPFPLPPLAEQHHIVVKVDELMALCDRLEAEQADAGATHTKLVATLLGTLTQSTGAADLAANWQRLAEHFDTLFTTEASLDALKQTILQLAVMGKLVPQDPNDEPASELLKRIAKERARLEAEGACKKILVSLPVAESELPFSVPKDWTWRRLDELLAISGGVTLGRKLADRNAVSRPYLRVANVQRGKLLLDHMKSLEVPAVELAKYRLESGDLLITEGGDWDKVGRTAIWRGEIPECLHQNHVFRARPLSAGWCSRWTEMYLNADPARTYFAASSKQTTNLASINMKQLKSCPFPVPPLPEQHRIVAKVDELMALVDRLQAGLAESRARQERLAATLIESALQAA